MAYFTDTETSDMVLMGMTIMVIDDQNSKIYGPMITYWLGLCQNTIW